MQLTPSQAEASLQQAHTMAGLVRKQTTFRRATVYFVWAAVYAVYAVWAAADIVVGNNSGGPAAFSILWFIAPVGIVLWQLGYLSRGRNRVAGPSDPTLDHLGFMMLTGIPTNRLMGSIFAIGIVGTLGNNLLHLPLSGAVCGALAASLLLRRGVRVLNGTETSSSPGSSARPGAPSFPKTLTFTQILVRIVLYSVGVGSILTSPMLLIAAFRNAGPAVPAVGSVVDIPGAGKMTVTGVTGGGTDVVAFLIPILLLIAGCALVYLGRRIGRSRPDNSL